MDYEDLDSIFDRRNVSPEQPVRKLGYNEHATAAAFDVQGLKAYETQHSVGARKGFPDREFEANPRSDAVSVVYASVKRPNRSGLGSSSQQTDESNQFLYGQDDRNLGYGVQREGGQWQDNRDRDLYSTVQHKLDQSVGYPSYGAYNAGFGDRTSSSYRYSEHEYGNAGCEANINRDGIYSFVQAPSADEGFHSTASLGGQYSRDDRGIYEFEQPVATPRSGDNIHGANAGYWEFQEPRAGSNFGDIGYGSRPFDAVDRNIYSFIRSDSVVEDEHLLANPRGSGDAFLGRDVLQIAVGLDIHFIIERPAHFGWFEYFSSSLAMQVWG